MMLENPNSFKMKSKSASKGVKILNSSSTALLAIVYALVSVSFCSWLLSSIFKICKPQTSAFVLWCDNVYPSEWQFEYIKQLRQVPQNIFRFRSNVLFRNGYLKHLQTRPQDLSRQDFITICLVAEFCLTISLVERTLQKSLSFPG